MLLLSSLSAQTLRSPGCRADVRRRVGASVKEFSELVRSVRLLVWGKGWTWLQGVALEELIHSKRGKKLM